MSACVGVEAGDVVQLYLVEEDHLARERVARDGPADLSHAQAVLLPLELHRGVAADLLDLGPLRGLEELLPAHVYAVGEVADVHQPLLGELRDDAWVKKLVDLAAVDDGRLAAARGGLRAEEPLLERPAPQVRALVVEEDGLVGRVGRGLVDLLALALARQVAVIAEEFGVDGLRELLEVGDRVELEVSEEDRAVFAQLGVDEL